MHTVEKKRGPEKVDENKVKEYPKENWTPNVQRLARRIDNCKVFFCDLCPYRVRRSDSMVKHVVRVHGKGLVRPQYMCEVCGKTFVDWAYFRNHRLGHTRDKQYSCEICGRRFHRKPSLKRHFQSHSHEKPFSCSQCDYKTSRRHLLLKHTENHLTGNSHTCKYCHGEFYTQLSLRSHLYLHHPSRHSCSFCQISFSSRERMWSHMQKMHLDFEIKYIETKYDVTQDARKADL